MKRPRDSETVTGTFVERTQALDAVEALVEASVPSNVIDVVLVDREGLHSRSLRVHKEMSALRWLGVGAMVGAVFGALGFGLLAGGVFGPVSFELLSESVAIAILQGTVLGAAVGMPIGALRGLLHWRTTVKLTKDEVEHGSVLISVHGDSVADTAEQVLSDSGARHLSR